MIFQVLDNNKKVYNAEFKDNRIVIPHNQISKDIEYIDIIVDEFNAKTGDEGYYVVADVVKDAQHRGSHIVKFTEKPDYEIVSKQDLLPIFGVKINDKCFLGIVESVKQNFFSVVGIKNGNYYSHIRFEVTDFGISEDIVLYIVDLGKDADYNTMANFYREYQLENKNCVPIKERIKNNKYLKYAVEAPEIRIRMGWKPAPSPIAEQTVENEPEMHVACTFDRVKDFVDELKKQGVDKAQICLVGWNKSGHDGRYPQIFPVEEKLGGEEKLRELISYAQDNGYQIVCHTNSTDSYSIADRFSEDIVIRKSNGEFDTLDTFWSAGKPYNICPKKALEFAKEDIPKIAELGFRGLHYIDVITIIANRECYAKNHPSTKKDTMDCYNEIMKLCHDEIGGFASEGAFDFAAKYLDYALYISWGDLDDSFFDGELPLWELVYHGIILYNPSTVTLNCTIKGKKNVDKLLGYGGRPSFYLYSKFLIGGSIDWLGAEDLFIDTDEQLEYTVSKIKEIYDDYKESYHLQQEYFVSYEKIDDEKVKIKYSDGTEIVV